MTSLCGQKSGQSRLDVRTEYRAVFYFCCEVAVFILKMNNSSDKGLLQNHQLFIVSPFLFLGCSEAGDSIFFIKPKLLTFFKSYFLQEISS